MRESQVIKKLQRAWKRADFEAGDFHSVEVAIAFANKQLLENKDWTSLQDVLGTLRSALITMRGTA